MDSGFHGREVGDKRKKKNQKNSNTRPYNIKKLLKTNTQKLLFLNILRCNHLPIKTKNKTLLFIYTQITIVFLHLFFKDLHRLG